MIIPAEQLSVEALQGLIESFITREGTDYGTHEMSLADKVAQLRGALAANEVVIVYDAMSESVNLMTQHDYQQWCVSHS